MICPEPVSPLSPCSFLASPKSVTRGLPFWSSRMLPGLRSRWITPRRWAYSIASATFAINSAASRGGKGPSASRCARLWPSTKPMLK